MTQKIPPPSNEDEHVRRTLSAQQKKIETQKVQKVEEADADARAKQRFRAYMQDNDDESDSASPTAPSPYEIQPTAQKGLSSSGLSPKTAVPSPTSSPPPNVNQVPSGTFDDVPNDAYSDEDLPQSTSFYLNSDMTDPYGEADSPPTFTETDSTTPRKKEAQQRVQAKQKQQAKEKVAKQQKGQKEESIPFGQKKGKIEPSPFGSPGKSVASKPFPGAKSPQKPGKEEETQPGAQFWESEHKIQSAPPATTSPKREPQRRVAGTSRPDELGPQSKQRKAPPKPFEPVVGRETPQEKAKGGGSQKQAAKKGPSEFISPSLTQLPGSVMPAAEAAAVAAAPYLSPVILAHYFQMIGTIFVMQKSGVSETEFLLNNPAFSNSKFFGSSIKITKYSTAPDAFNIRLSGSTDAVDAFKQSIPNLLAAFQKGNFNFRINRIDVHHATAKPVFHRKGKGQEKGDKQ